MSLACHCYSCNVDYPEFIYPSSDTQNLILQICKEFLKLFKMKILQKLFLNDILCKEIKRLSTDTWKTQFKWSESRYNDSLIKYLLKISKEWYDPFTRYLQHIDRQKRNEWLSDKDTNIKEDELKQLLLDNLADYLSGFKYLFEYSWDSYDDNNNLHKGDFIFASDSDAVKTKALKCKKYITLIGATFTNFTIELIDNDEIIMQNLKEFHNNQEINHNKLTHPSQQEESPSILNTGTITITAAAAAVVGYLIC
ncbi:hypothetical protein RhiirA4_454777 [Rhizophagus irregularis]|uniref:Uncharacterized protein n=1 Tax=Rhizophagus irregularis TaxID=588596 RepID=A0A2I1G3L8_9GLOM|nr:hypothetical protein RhiirA4_454777 [Rhizophagus irregularis]